MNPYQKAVVVAVRTVAILLFAYWLFFAAQLVISGSTGIATLLMVFVIPLAIYLLAVPIALLATLGVK